MLLCVWLSLTDLISVLQIGLSDNVHFSKELQEAVCVFCAGLLLTFDGRGTRWKQLSSRTAVGCTSCFLTSQTSENGIKTVEQNNRVLVLTAVSAPVIFPIAILPFFLPSILQALENVGSSRWQRGFFYSPQSQTCYHEPLAYVVKTYSKFSLHPVMLWSLGLPCGWAPCVNKRNMVRK